MNIFGIDRPWDQKELTKFSGDLVRDSDYDFFQFYPLDTMQQHCNVSVCLFVRLSQPVLCLA